MKKHLIKYKKNIFLAIIFITTTSMIQISFEFFKGWLLDSALSSNIYRFIVLAIGFFLAFLLKALTHYMYTLYFKVTKTKILSNMRNDFFKTLLKRSYPSFLKNKTGEYLFKYTTQMDLIEKQFFESSYGLLQILTETAFSILALIMIDIKLAIVAVLLLILPTLLPHFLKNWLAKKEENKLNTMTAHLGRFDEWIRGFELIKNYGAVNDFLNIFKNDTERVRDSNSKFGYSYMLGQNISALLSNFSLFGMIVAGALLVIKGELGVGMFITSVGIMESLQSMIVYVVGYIQQLMVVKIPINSIENTGEYEDIKGTQKIEPGLVNSIQFNGVTFDFNPESVSPMLNNISIKAEEKGLYLIMGDSGCGKSTLMNLLMNYYSPSCGCVLINGIPVEQIGNLTELITVQRQEAVFFEDSLKNNLNMYREYPYSDIKKLMNNMNLSEYSDEKSLNEKVIHNGANFSGGECRRLTMVRSLLRNSDILILDEPFANVDEHTMNSLAREIMEIKDKFIFIITHQIPSEVDLKYKKLIQL